MLTDRGKGHDDEGKDGNQGKLRKCEGRESEPCGTLHGCEVDDRIGREDEAHDEREEIARKETHENGDYGEEALEEYVEHHGHSQGEECYREIDEAVG